MQMNDYNDSMRLRRRHQNKHHARQLKRLQNTLQLGCRLIRLYTIRVIYVKQ